MTFITLLRVEWIKAMRMRSTYIAFAAAGVLCVLVQLGIYSGADESQFYQFLSKNGFNTSLLLNGFAGTRVALEVGFRLLLAPMVILTFARQVSGEDLRGTLRLILARPISRTSLMAAKFLVSSAHCVLLMGFFLSLSYGVGLVLYGPQDSITIGRLSELDSRNYASEETEAPEELSHGEYRGMTDDARNTRRSQWQGLREVRNFTIAKYVISARECAGRLLIVWALTSWALMSLGAIAIFFSSFNRHPIAAMALTIGLYFMVGIMQMLASAEMIIPIFRWLEPYLITGSMDFWGEAMSYELDWSTIGRDAALLGVYTCVFFGAATLIFRRRDLTG